jgi:hypothetical protein
MTISSEQGLFVPLLISENKRSQKRLHSYEFFLRPNGQARIRRIPQSGMRSVRCPGAVVPAAPRGTPAASLAPNSALFVALEVEADSRLYRLYRADTASLVALVLSRVNDIHTSQLGLTLRLKQLTIFSNSASDPYGAASRTSGALLSKARTRGIGTSADLKHLMTSQRSFIDAVGLAYLSVTCTQPEYSFGWSDYANGFYYFVVPMAHELGHNFSASHDSANPTTIMGLSDDPRADQYFSDFSKGEIQSFLNQGGNACLTLDDGTEIATPPFNYPKPYENPANVRVSASLLRYSTLAYIRGRVTTKSGIPLARRVVELRRYSGTLLVTVHTNSRGEYQFTVRRRGRYFTADRMSLRTCAYSLTY